MVGVFVCGIVSDIYGRKPIMMISLIIFILAGFCGSFISNFYIWMISRFLIGGATLSMNTCLSVFTGELCSAKNRPLINMLTGNLAWNVGHLTIGLLVYLIPDMLLLELVMPIGACFFLSLYWVMTESPRWLLAKGRTSEANEIIEKICKINGREFKPVETQTYQGRSNLKELFQFPGIRRNFLSMCLCWFSFSMGFFGLTYNTPAKQGSVYLIFISPVFFSPIAFVFSPMLQRKIGRKAVLSGSLILGGIFTIATMLIPSKEELMITIFAVAGLLCVGLSFECGYNFTKELFPTVLRTTALSSVSAIARIGSISAPLIGALDVYDPTLPLAIYGSVALIAGLQSVILWPDTTHGTLPDTCEDSEELAQTPNEWLSCCKK